MKKLLLLFLLVPIIAIGQKSYTIPENSSANKKLEILRMNFIDFASNEVKGLNTKLKSGKIRLKNYEYQNSIMMEAALNAKNILYKINLRDNDLNKLPSIITMIYEDGEFKFWINNRLMNASDLYRFL